MSVARRATAAAALATLFAAGCDTRPSGGATTATPTPASAPPAASAPPTTTAATASAQCCRILGVTGQATLSSLDGGGISRLGLGATPAPHAWVALEDATKLQTKNPRTGRELAFDGPGRVQPCNPSATGDDEEAWVQRGRFASAPGSGEAPGQEQWVVTPLGVVRYAAATAQVRVDADVSVRVAQGAAWLWVAADARRRADAAVDADGWTRLGAESAEQIVPAGTGAPNLAAAASSALAECKTAARDAWSLAHALAEKAGGPLGELPVQHVVARRRARAACAVAGLRAAALDGPERTRLTVAVRVADFTWSALPSASADAAPPAPPPPAASK